jgi:ParB/RepB/Spo0J family partition protein
VQTDRFEFVKLNQLQPSKTNPRRHFEGMEEMEESIRQHGVITPLLVRPVNGYLEIVAGERRYRGAKAAKVESIPVRIREMDDDTALKLQVIENLQRKDVHYLDEGLGFQLLRSKGYDVARIAVEISKSESYVHQRIKLSDLIEPAQKMCFENKMTAGHAILLARLRPEHQKEVLKWFRDDSMSVRYLSNRIHDEFHLELRKACFPTDDADLVPLAGSCTVCPKRSGANPGLFPDIKHKEICTDAVCFHGKEQAFVQLQLEKNPQSAECHLTVGTSYGKKPKGMTEWKPAAGKHCAHIASGVVTEILENWQAEQMKVKLGEVIEFCNHPKCPVHAQKRISDGAYEARTGHSRASEKKRKKELKRRAAIFRAMAMGPKPAEPDKGELQSLIRWAIRCLSSDEAKAFCNAMGWEAKPSTYGGRDYAKTIEQHFAKEPKRFETTFGLLLLGVAGEDLWFWAGGGIPKVRMLEDAAKARGIKPKLIAKELEAKAKPKPKGKKAAA